MTTGPDTTGDTAALPDDGHRYALAGPRGVSPFLDALAPEAEQHTITVYGSADLARRLAQAHEASVCVTFHRLDEPTTGPTAATGDEDDDGF